MLDLKFVRENPDIVKQNIKNKFQEDKLPLVDEVIALDAEARKTQQEADELRARRRARRMRLSRERLRLQRSPLVWKSCRQRNRSLQRRFRRS